MINNIKAVIIIFALSIIVFFMSIFTIIRQFNYEVSEPVSDAKIIDTPAAMPPYLLPTTQTDTPAPTPMPAPARVLIDPGHGGSDYGASSDTLGIDEKAVNMYIALKLYSLLQQDRDRVYVNMTRFSDASVSLHERASMANASYDFMISIHCNTSNTSSVCGISGFYQTHAGIDKPFTSEELARTIQGSAAAATNAHDRGIVEDYDLYILNHTTIPTVLIETGFLTNPLELKQLQDSVYVDKLAEGLRLGILEMANRVIESRR